MKPYARPAVPCALRESLFMQTYYSFFESGSTTPRMDIYANIHKGLRAMMADVLMAVGKVDVQDSADLLNLCDRVQVLGDACARHLEHENLYIHPAMEACRPRSTEQVNAEHLEHLSAISRLSAAASRLRTAPSGAEQAQAALALYRMLAHFVAENFIHMHTEEMENNQVLWACYSDAELRALEGRIAASLAPAESMLFMRWMVPAMTPSDRTAMLVAMQDAAPPPVLAAVLDVVHPHLSPRDWSKLIGELHLARLQGELVV